MLNTEPPGIVRTAGEADRPRVHAIRERIRSLAQANATNSLQLAWELGEVYGKELWRGFINEATKAPFTSFDAYVQHDLDGCVGRSRAYELASAGIYFTPAKAEIETMLADHVVGITRLTRLAALCKQGEATFLDCMQALRDGAVLPAEAAPQHDPEQFVKLTIAVPRGDAPHVRRGLLYHALRSGYATIDDAARDLAIGESLNETLPATYERFLAEISDGSFGCRLCGRLPRQPTEHHIVPRSIAGDDSSPTVILCQTPCHLEVVQKRWKFYGAKFLGTARFNELLKKYKTAGRTIPDEDGPVPE